MAIKIHKITNANIYVDGEGQLGRALEVTLPEVQMVMQEHAGLGMLGKIELPIGIDKAEGEIKWGAFYEDTMGRISDPFPDDPAAGAFERWRLRCAWTERGQADGDVHRRHCSKAFLVAPTSTWRMRNSPPNSASCTSSRWSTA